MTLLEDQKEKIIKNNEDNIRNLWDNIKHTNIQIIGVWEEEERAEIKTYLKK